MARVLRLHRRAGFGATWAQAQRDLADGYEPSISRVLNGAPTGPDGRGAQALDAFAEAMFQSYQAVTGGHVPVRTAWLHRAVFTAFPLRERMLLAWHTHYATSEAKLYERMSLIAQHATQRKLWRERISKLHLAMLRDEAMLRWLDGTENLRTAPNENLAREFFELFALGVGNYSERDVRETARALTGWQRVYNLPKDIRYLAALHDPDDKTILGQTGRWNDEDVARIACAQPAAALRIAWRLWRTFVSDVDDPTPDLLEGLAAPMRVDGDVDVARGLEVLLRSRLFHSDAYAFRRVLSPVEWLVTVLRAGETFPPHPDLGEVASAAEAMGQRLFRPPNVAGWPGGVEWLTGAALVARENFAAWLTSGESTVAADHWQKLAARHAIAPGDAELDFWTSLFWGRTCNTAQRASLAASLAGADGRTAFVRDLLCAPLAQLA